MARACELLHSTSGTVERTAFTESAVRIARIDHHAAGMRRGRRKIPPGDLQLDGARLSVRKGSSEHLVSRTATRRRRLIPKNSQVPRAESIPPRFCFLSQNIPCMSSLRHAHFEK